MIYLIIDAYAVGMGPVYLLCFTKYLLVSTNHRLVPSSCEM